MRLHGKCIFFNRSNQAGTRTVHRYIIPMAMIDVVPPKQYHEAPNGGIRVKVSGQLNIWISKTPSQLAGVILPTRS